MDDGEAFVSLSARAMSIHNRRRLLAADDLPTHHTSNSHRLLMGDATWLPS
jgi:hypothetical protein